MMEQHFPPGWDEDRVKRLIAHYDALTEDEQVAEDEAAVSEQQGQKPRTMLFDADNRFLEKTLAHLDGTLAMVYSQIEKSPDPDGYGLLDDAEFLTGLGFVLCQRYITSTYGFSLDKSTALAMPPTHPGGKTIAQIVNAVANTWKHSDEWPPDEPTPRARPTIDVIETVTPFNEYAACSLLHCLTGSTSLMGLLPMLEEWRDNLAASAVRRQSPISGGN
jgi:hypothetical protein